LTPPTPQQQQHLRTLRRSLNRAVTALKADERVVLSSGWGYGRAFGHPRLSGGRAEPWPEEQELYLMFPIPEEGNAPLWQQHELIPDGVERALDFFWPGPLVLGVRCPATRQRLKLACPWHPLMMELLSRHGSCLWTPLSEQESRQLAERAGESEVFQGERTLLWPDPEVPLRPTYLDASTVPWRLMEAGFVEIEELAGCLDRPFLLSEERAFPRRSLRTFQPQHKTVVLEAASRAELPGLVEKFREQIGPEWSLRVYLDESVAFTHFPDDRGVRVYGELSDPERVRRRLEAMLERQRRRSGKRILLIGVAEMDAATESLRADLAKMADRWLSVPPGGRVNTDEFG
jgi:hypothetical protein